MVVSELVESPPTGGAVSFHPSHPKAESGRIGIRAISDTVFMFFFVLISL